LITFDNRSKIIISNKRLGTKEARTANSTYKKLAIQWLNEALCFVSSSVTGRQFCASKSPTSCSGKTLPGSLKDDTENLNGHLENISLTNNKTGKAENRLE
jgi:hypothetical protein